MHTEIVLNLLLATLIGAAIGLERQWRQRFIGLSTNALVALGAASFTYAIHEHHLLTAGCFV